MAFVEHTDDQVSGTLRQILELSLRISCHSSPNEAFCPCLQANRRTLQA